MVRKTYTNSRSIVNAEEEKFFPSSFIFIVFLEVLIFWNSFINFIVCLSLSFKAFFVAYAIYLYLKTTFVHRCNKCNHIYIWDSFRVNLNNLPFLRFKQYAFTFPFLFSFLLLNTHCTRWISKKMMYGKTPTPHYGIFPFKKILCNNNNNNSCHVRIISHSIFHSIPLIRSSHERFCFSLFLSYSSHLSFLCTTWRRKKFYTLQMNR